MDCTSRGAAAGGLRLWDPWRGLVIAAERRDWGPVRHRRRQRRRIGFEVALAVHDPAAKQSQNRAQVDNLSFGNAEIIVGQDGEVGQLTGLDYPFLADF